MTIFEFATLLKYINKVLAIFLTWLPSLRFEFNSGENLLNGKLYFQVDLKTFGLKGGDGCCICATFVSCCFIKA